MKTIVMTGVSSGIGRVAAERLLALGCGVIGGVCEDGAPARVDVRPLDLGDFDSVRRFASSLSGIRIDGLALHAGVQLYDVKARTAQGFEKTFGVNHLGHLLLVRLLLPQLAEGAAVVFTTSGAHDPDAGHRFPPPLHARAEWLAYPERDPTASRWPMIAGLRAYTASKLCNVMTVRMLRKNLGLHACGVRVVAYDPGFTPGTGLVRDAPWMVRSVFWPMMLRLTFAPGINSVNDAGFALADLAEGTTVGDGTGYCSLRNGTLRWIKPSLLAMDDAACARLWMDSEKLLGMG